MLIDIEHENYGDHDIPQIHPHLPSLKTIKVNITNLIHNTRTFKHMRMLNVWPSSLQDFTNVFLCLL